MFRVPRPITTNDELRTIWGKARVGLKWLAKGTGPLGVGINQAGLFTKSCPGLAPGRPIPLLNIVAELTGTKPHDWSGCTFSVCQLRPKSRGYVQIKAPDPMEPPSMRPNYLSAETDRICVVESIKYARRLAATQALKPYLIGEYKPGDLVRSDDEILDFARGYGATIFHPSGTCKMGSDRMAVTDARLRVHGISRLRVVDCSIMPTLVSGNTHAPAVMIAEKASDMIIDDARERAFA